MSGFRYFSDSPRGGAPFLEVLQYQVDAWSERSKLLFQLPAPKIHLIYCPRIEDVSDIKLIRTDTTLDLSQKAEKQLRVLSNMQHSIINSIIILQYYSHHVIYYILLFVL